MTEIEQKATNLQELKNQLVKNKIYDIVKNNKIISFDDLFQNLIQDNVTNSKQELSQYLRILESEKNIFQYSGSYYDLNGFEHVEGFPQWNLNGFCWLENSDLSNPYGITFNSNENLLTVFNKRDLGYGCFIKGKRIDLEERSFVYVTESTPVNNKKIIGTVNLEKNKIFSLNSNLNYSFTIPDSYKFNQDDIVIFNSQDFSLIEVIGNKKDKGIEDKIITLLSNLQEAPESSFESIVKSNKKLDKPFYTIDSPYTSDIDDAIFTEAFPDKNEMKLYVAIADVSSYVKPGDVQDNHAKEQCSSFYLANKTIHMLDKKLAEKFCSLNVGEARSSMVCELTYKLDSGELLSSQFYQAEIKSKARLTYDDVDRIINGINPQESFLFKNGNVEKFNQLEQSKDIVQSLEVLRQFTEQNKRINVRDYWIVETPEYVLGEDGKISYLKYRDENVLSQKMVETAMLSANIAAAEFIYKNYPVIGLFRNQTEPENGKRPKPATYGGDNSGHWGLKTPFYTHFTSPIRRYCDLMVHRLIKNIIQPENNEAFKDEDIKNIIQQINIQQYKAKQNDMKTYDLLLSQYVENLSQQKTLNTQVEFVDFSETGVVFKNKQHIEFFIPTFKLENYVTRVINKLLPQEDRELTIEEKQSGIEKLNSTWDINIQMAPYSWTDERKNVLYQFNRKEKNLTFSPK